MSTPAVVTEARVRFCPSPTGTPHVGLLRTALFNWAYARRTGGRLVLRIEDVDAPGESGERVLDALRLLGLDWDEGPEVGGPHGPYRQSERRAIYADLARRLLDAGELYESFSTASEVAARRVAAGQDPKLGYDNHDRDLTDARKAAFRAEGRAPVLRLRLADEDIAWHDLVHGAMAVKAGATPDPVLFRANGDPLHTFTNPVDDALMRVTHVLRDADHLPSTPRQLGLHAALRRIGAADSTPRFGHLPHVLGDGDRKLSKRDPRADLSYYRRRGFLPEGLLNYLALLGWSTADDHDVFTAAEFAAMFSLARISAKPVRFDLKKAEAVNAAHLRAMPVEEFIARVLPRLAEDGVLVDPTDEQLAALREVAPLVQGRLVVLAEASGMVRFLFADEAEFAPEGESAAQVLGADARPVLTASITALESLPEWTAAAIGAALKESLVDGLGLKPRKAYAPVRVAVTGRTVSPPLYESMELVGRDRSIGRLRKALGAM
ncbi:glutamate--tRNA ligase [Saccharothrix obliqua]|uniref:glutamate--tRNA ligase n=1 Tax=Saccharothrix obliqua TaxID=2861747 RepID=UPI001C5E3A7F|nr:glutamate--tRNA ligase [Saccharothrix obliqua]MBW4716609.1 glutamate--tRNA ligase [Saccharothrix obliqua]